jgi:hypothetical protein
MTSLYGLGARITYSFSLLLAFEADVMAGRSGDARFHEVPWSNMRVDMVRIASVGRVRMGGVLRFGERYIPTVRAGIGAQGASHRATVVADGATSPGPDLRFEVDGMWYFGGGLDIRLGERMVAGAAVSFDQSMVSDSRSLQLGVHMGYAWKP